MRSRWTMRKPREISIGLSTHEWDNPFAKQLFGVRNYVCELFPYLDANDNISKIGISSGDNLEYYQVAIDYLQEAMINDKHIVIYGDYDVDGMTSVAALYNTLVHIYDIRKVHYIIPNRVTGYGLNVEYVLSELANMNISNCNDVYIITVDTGISSFKEVDELKKLGCRILVTDHHLLEGTPPECPIVNPKVTFGNDNNSEYHVPGVYVASKIAWHLLDKYSFYDSQCTDALNIRDMLNVLTAFGIVSDIIDVDDETCRLQLWKGLTIMNSLADRPNIKVLGLSILLTKCGYKGNHPINSQFLSYSVIPKLNSSGRMNEPEAGVKVLITDDLGAGIESLNDILESRVDKLLDMNAYRKSLEDEVMDLIIPNADKLISEYENSLIINVTESDNKYLAGVVGILAARLVEKYNVPVIVLHRSEDGMLKGSGRTSGDFNLHTFLVDNSKLLERFGGHKQAVGLELAIDNLDELRRSMSDSVKQYNNVSPSIEIDVDNVDVTDLQSVEIQSYISLLEPFGKGNPEVILKLNNVKIAYKDYNPDKSVLVMVVMDDENNSVALRKYKPPIEWINWQGMDIDVLISPSYLYYGRVTSIDWKLIDIRDSKYENGDNR